MDNKTLYYPKNLMLSVGIEIKKETNLIIN